MENQEFQKSVLTHFEKLTERLGNIEEFLKQHHEDTEKIAVQVEQIVTTQEKMQHDMNYLLRKTADHDDALILLKKAK